MNWAVLLYAIMTVESGGDPKAIGDNGASHGAFQIQQPYLDDFHRITDNRTGWTLQDMHDTEKARYVTYKVLTHYGRAYEAKTGQKPDMEVYARLHNGGWGLYWRNRGATDGYWNKVRKVAYR